MFYWCMVETVCLASDPCQVEKELSRVGRERERKDVRGCVLGAIRTIKDARSRVTDKNDRQLVRISQNMCCDTRIAARIPRAAYGTVHSESASGASFS